MESCEYLPGNSTSIFQSDENSVNNAKKIMKNHQFHPFPLLFRVYQLKLLVLTLIAGLRLKLRLCFLICAGCTIVRGLFAVFDCSGACTVGDLVIGFGGIFSIITDDVLAINVFGLCSLIVPALTVRGITEIDGGSAAFTMVGIICIAFGDRVIATGIGEFDFNCGLIGLMLLVNALDRLTFSLGAGTRFDVTVNARLLLICCTAFVAASTVVVVGFLMIVAMGWEFVLFSCGVVTAETRKKWEKERLETCAT